MPLVFALEPAPLPVPLPPAPPLPLPPAPPAPPLKPPLLAGPELDVPPEPMPRSFAMPSNGSTTITVEQQTKRRRGVG